ncbi:MAG: saccharopine dehydrogenase NADP-binding domain-containing protein, partial [Candidatus Acidiferrales bacterium]
CGALLAKHLLRQGHDVWCGDRDPARAARFLGPAIPVEPVNARNQWSIVRAARGCHLLVNAAPATFNETVLRATLRLRAHYLDMAANLGRNPFKAEQLRYERRFREKNRAAVICAGAAPGLTNLLAARAADLLGSLEQVHIRLYESVESEAPVSMWSADIAFDEAISRPRIYRDRRFHLGRRFSEPEWFQFPAPLGRTRVVLAAQDEVATLPHFLKLRELDVKIGGNEIDRLRRWYRQGRLRPSAPRPKKHFPHTLTPRQVGRLIRRGVLTNARFAAAVVARGVKPGAPGRAGRPLELRWDCAFPSLYQILLRGLFATPVAFATAHAAAVFVKHFPRDLPGVHPPEALPAPLRSAILSDLKDRGFALYVRVRPWKKPELDDEDI